MKENWYQLEYEKDENDRDCCGPTVLYTSRSGLEHMVAALQEIAKNGQAGRHAVRIEEADSGYYPPFTHVEIADAPPEDREAGSTSLAPLWWILGAVVVALALALYGLGRLAVDLVALAG